MRRFCLLLLLAACRPTLDEDLSHVDGPRLLAVQSEPAEAKPGDAVQLHALYTDGTTTASAPLRWDLCIARRALAEPTELGKACLDGAPGALVSLPSGPGTSGAVPADACRLFGPERPLATVAGEPAGRPSDPDVTGGYFLPGIVHAPAADDAIFQIRIACGLSGATQDVVADYQRRYAPNRNPVVSEITVTHADGRSESPAEGGVVEATANEQLGVRAAWTACGDEPCTGSELYPVFDPSARVLVNHRESIVVSWLATRGPFADTRSSRDENDPATDVSTRFTATSTATIWVVLRDARGGTGMRSFTVHVP